MRCMRRTVLSFTGRLPSRKERNLFMIEKVDNGAIGPLPGRFVCSKRRKTGLLAMLAMLYCAPLFSETQDMKIQLTVDGRTVTATLANNPTTRDFLSLLPLTLTLEDYAGTEKIAYLSRKLSNEGAPAGIDPEVGDITYYAPWGNLALFYKDFGYAKGLIKLGSIDGGMEVFSISGSVSVTIEPL